MAGADAVAPRPWPTIPSDERSKFYVLLGHRDGPSVVAPSSLAPRPMPVGAPVHGPEIGFARTLQTRMPDDYLLVKSADNIPPTEPDFLWAVDKPYMQRTLRFFETACALEKVSPCPDAILMAQGIDEALSVLRCPHYKSNLYACIKNLRAYFSKPDLPFIIKRSVNSPQADPGRMASIRQAQESASLELRKVGLVSVDDLTPYVNGHHLSSPAQIELGRRFALTFLDLTKRHPFSWRGLRAVAKAVSARFNRATLIE